MTALPLFNNNATTRLATAVAAADTSVQVMAGAGALFPDPAAGEFFLLTLEDRRTGQIEITKCTARSGDLMTVERAQEGTIAQDFLAFATASNRFTAGTWAAITGAVYDKDAADARFVNTDGDTMTGPLLLPAAAPVAPTEATSKQYVDAQIAAVGGVTEAPLDGKVYARGSAAWTESLTKTAIDAADANLQAQVTANTNNIATLQTDLDALELAVTGKVGEAPNDGQMYVRQSNAWAVAPFVDAYTKTQADTRFINVSGDAMSGPLVLVGASTADTAAPGNNTQQIATTAFVTSAVVTATAGLISEAPSDGKTYARRNNAWIISYDKATLDLTLATLAPLASPALTGNPTAPTPTAGDNDTSIATTAFVVGALTPYAPLASPAFTGNPTAPTPPPGDSDTSIATTAFVVNLMAGSGFAPLNSPVFAGDPRAPTPLTADNDTSIATTAYVKAQGYLSDAPSDGTTYGRKNGAWSATAAGLPEAPIDGKNYVRKDAAWADGGAVFAPLASPAFTGNPTAPTPTAGDNDTSIATTEFVQAIATGKIGNIVVKILSSSGSYVKPANLLFAEVICPGAGGGGSSALTTVASEGSSGAGGGGGGTAIKLFKASDLAASTAYTVGARGAAAQTPTDGGASTFGPLTGAGGQGASAISKGTTPVYSPGGPGGTATGGDINIAGERGGYSWRLAHNTNVAITGDGGASYLARQMRGLQASGSVVGSDGNTPGGGGSGAGNGPSQSGAIGGYGGTTYIKVTEYLAA